MDYKVPTDECDLVMKGGITSGVVYPPAILALAKRYRFRGIGGASAGAIAAAIAAAAEHGRDAGGFDRLAEMSEELGKPGFLLKLLAPRPEAKPLFDALLDAKRRLAARDERTTGAQSPVTRLAALRADLNLAHDVLTTCASDATHRGAIVGALVGATSAAVLLGPPVVAAAGAVAPGGALAIVWLVSVALSCAAVGRFVGAFVGGGRVLVNAATTVAGNDESLFGLCSGMPETADGEALTSWLARGIDRAAGDREVQAPLTFRGLAAKGVELRMITTNLSQGQPYLLPLDRPQRTFLFAERDMCTLFPADVVAYLVDWGRSDAVRRQERNRGESAPPTGYYLFPFEQDLPVVVATRLSLSFPILLSAVRLYTVRTDARADGRALTEADLEEHWFSDGGIASNFPIHLFDAWMPSRPTFGLNLCDSALTTKAHPPRRPLEPIDGDDAGDVFLPRARDTQKVRPKAIPIEGPFAFLKAVFDTAQSFRDNAQAMLPSYRERIAHIGLDANEGGLNLDMGPEVIARIEEKGRTAARLLVERFDLDEHRWVRSCVLLARIEHELEALRKLQPAGPTGRGSLRESYRELLDSQLARFETENAWYKPKNQVWCAEAVARADGLFALVEQWAERQALWAETHRAQQTFFQHEGPVPGGILRVTPEV